MASAGAAETGASAMSGPHLGAETSQITSQISAPCTSKAGPRHPKPRSSSRTFGLAVYFVSPPRPTWRSNRQPAHPLTCPGKWRQRRREVKPAARPPTCLSRQVAARAQRGQTGSPPTHLLVAASGGAGAERSNRQPAHPLACPGKWRQRRREVKPAARPPTHSWPRLGHSWSRQVRGRG